MPLRGSFNTITSSEAISGRNLMGLGESEVVTVWHAPSSAGRAYTFRVQARPIGSVRNDDWRDATDDITESSTITTIRVSKGMEYRVLFSANTGCEIFIG